jgi:putative proteasome-type protease
MTYCCGILVRDGLVMFADTRTNAGVDNIASYRKLHVIEKPGERVLACATSGNLSMTQMAMTLAEQGMVLPGDVEPTTFANAPTMFRAAELAGHAMAQARRNIAPSLEADDLTADGNMLFGGQIRGGPAALYFIYSQGNFIACGPDTPYLQIGEFKFGKPILERALHSNTPLDEAVKLGFLSVDSTLRSNVAVGFPLDTLVLRRDVLTGIQRRIEATDAYFNDLASRWSAALAAGVQALPAPAWLDPANANVATPPAGRDARA